MKYYIVFNDNFPSGKVLNELQLSQARIGGGYTTAVEIDAPTEETIKVIEQTLFQCDMSTKH